MSDDGSPPAKTKYRIRVQRWVCYEGEVEVEAHKDRDARERALLTFREQRGTITKNKTTILSKAGA